MVYTPPAHHNRAPISTEGLIPKPNLDHLDLRGVSLAPSLNEWRNAPPEVFEIMIRQHYDRIIPDKKK